MKSLRLLSSSNYHSWVLLALPIQIPMLSKIYFSLGTKQKVCSEVVEVRESKKKKQKRRKKERRI